MYVDNASFLSGSPGGLEEVITVGVRAYGLGGQDRNHLPATIGGGHGSFNVAVAGQVHKQTAENRHLSRCRGNASTPEGMDVLRAV